MNAWVLVAEVRSFGCKRSLSHLPFGRQYAEERSGMSDSEDKNQQDLDLGPE